jgi:hypothetical protein
MVPTEEDICNAVMNSQIIERALTMKKKTAKHPRQEKKL